MNHTEIYVGAIAWLIKEIYQSYKGSRKQTLDSVSAVKVQLSSVQADLKKALIEIETLDKRLSYFASEKREYRK